MGFSGTDAKYKLKEAEDEAETSTADTSKLSMKSHKGLPMHEDSSFGKEIVSYPCSNIIWTPVIKYNSERVGIVSVHK